MAEIITYAITNGDFPITVTLATTLDPDTIIATNEHWAYGEYSFENIPSGDYILTITDARGCTIGLEACNLTPTIDTIVYNCEFDFTFTLVNIVPSPSITPTVTPSLTITPTPTLTPSLTPSITPSETPSPTPSATPIESPSITPSETPSITPSETPSPTPSETPSITPSETPSPTPSETPSITPSETPSITPSETPSITPSITPSETPSITPSETPSPTPSITPSASCARPEGLKEYVLFYTDSLGYNFISSQDEACDALCVGEGSAIGGFASSLTIGQDVYAGPAGSTSCELIPTGYYITIGELGVDWWPPMVVYIVDGIVISFPECGPCPLVIIDADADCDLDRISITITGGIPPYQYSIDNGVTLTAPTDRTTQRFTGLPGGIYDVYVIDSDGSVYRWPEINCGNLHVTFIPIYLTSYSTGYLLDELGGHWTIPFEVIRPSLSTVDVIGTPTNTTVFLGWSYYTADRFTIDNTDMITTNPLLTYTFKNDNVIIYGYFIDDGPISIDFCYNAGTGRDPLDDDKIYLCKTCADLTGTTETIYFDKTEYMTLGIENTTWYKDSALTQLADNGYYVDSSQTYSTIYGVANGIPINYGTCPDGKLPLIC
jgi:hypothetical protein